MSELDTSFEKLLGRQASEKERQNLYRVKNALGLRDNDALWLVLMTLESYDTLLSKLPARMHEQVITTVEEVKGAARTAAEAETKQALHSLAHAVSETSSRIASRTVDNQRLVALAFYSISLFMFGALCLVAGFILGSGKMPWWASYASEASLTWKIVSAVAQAPAGWLVAAVGVLVTVALMFSSVLNREKVRLSNLLACLVLILIALGSIAPMF